MAERSRSVARSTAGRALLVLGLLTLLNYWPVLIGKVPFPGHIATQFPPWETVRGPHRATPEHAEMGDLVTQQYPWKAFLREGMGHGTLPLWNPHILMGAPFQASPLSAMFYPPNALYYLLPTPVAWALSFLLRTVLAGVLTALFLRSIGSGLLGAIASGVVFAFCGFLTAFQGWNQADSSLWLPLVCLSVDRLQRRPGAASVALAGIAFALPVLAGHPENAAHVTMVGAAFFLYRELRPGPAPLSSGSRGRVRFLALFAAAGLLALILSSVQLIPTLQWLGQLQRSLQGDWGARPAAEILTFVSHDLARNPNSANVVIPEGAAYAGILTLLVAPLAFLRRKRHDAAFFGVLAAACLSVVYGWGPLSWLLSKLPVLRGIPNWRLLVAVDFSLAVLAGLGLSALEEKVGSDSEGRRWTAWWLLPAAAGLACVVGVASLFAVAKTEEPASDWPARMAAFVRGPWASGVLLLASLLFLWFALRGRLAGRRLAVIAVGLLAVDLLSASYGHVPFVSAREIFPPAPVFDFLREKRAAAFRVASVDVTYGSNFEMMYGLDSPGGYDMLLRRTKRILSKVCTPSDALHLNSELVVRMPGRLLDLMNVRYLVATTWNQGADNLATRPDRFALVFTDGAVRVFENRAVLPRAFLVPASGVRRLADEGSELTRLCEPDFDPEKTVLVSGPQAVESEGPAPPGNREPRPSSGGAPAAPAYEQRINEVRLRCVAAEPSVLVLSQTHYLGWKAFVDGREAGVLRVDYAFSGVPLSPGNHDVRLAYKPEAFRAGLLVSSGGVLVALALLVFGRWPTGEAALRSPGSATGSRT